MTDKKKQGSTKTILIVDDEADICLIISTILKKAGYDTATAGNGKEALDRFKKGGIDAIVSDIRMPGGSGIELLENIKKSSPQTPVMLVTAYPDIIVQDVYNKGAEQVLLKPFDQKAILAEVDRFFIPRDELWADESAKEQPVKATIELSLSGPDKSRETHELNIGRGGIFVAMADSLPAVGDHVEIKLRFRYGMLGSISGIGVVRWRRPESKADLPSGVGIEFQYIDERMRSQLLEYLDRLTDAPFIPKT